MPLSRITSLFQSATANVYSPSANTVAIRTSSTDRFTVTSAGDVGIGTSSPQKKFAVSNSGAAGVELDPFTRSATTGASLLAYNRSGAAFVRMDYDASQHLFFLSGSLAMTLDSSGNLGLGVTPSAWGGAGYSGRALEIGAVGNSLWGVNATNLYLMNNVYYDGAFKYASTNAASRYLQQGGSHIWGTAASGTAGNAITFTQAMTLDASGRLGLGETNPACDLDISKASGDVITRYRNGTGTGIVGVRSDNAFTEVRAVSNHGIQFSTNNTERARITSGGTFLVAKTTDTFSVAGVQIAADGDCGITKSGTPLSVNRINTDGVLVAFYQDTVLEGNISVSGTAVSYNGGHLARWSQLLNGQRDESIVKGTVLSNLDEMCEWLDAEGNPLPNEQLNRMKVSDVEGDTNVAGVFVNWDNDDQDNPYDMNIAMTGDMIIRIAQGVTVQKGDLLMSAGDGTAKPQGDDIVRSKTIAKVTSNHVTCTYDDGSYCVPCVLMAC